MSRSNLAVPAILTVLVLAAPVSPAAAQITDAATINASVTVESTPVTVSGVQDLTFGTHFASEGVVENQGDGEWLIDGPAGSEVYISFNNLPTVLEDDTGANVVGLNYGSTSLSLWCDDGAGNNVMTSADPRFGQHPCLLAANGNILIELGNGTGGDGKVSVDLTDAPDGTYTALIELTATVN